jgi:hypothetical protein
MQPAIAAKVKSGLGEAISGSAKLGEWSDSLSDHDASSPRRSGAVSDTTAPGPEKARPSTNTGLPKNSKGVKTKERSGIIPHLGITTKQEAFCQAVTSGKSLADAYRSAYVTDNMTDNTLHHLACRLFADPKIRGRLQSINVEMEGNRRMMAASDVALGLRVLRELAESADSDAARIRAAELLAKVGGAFVEQVDITDKRDRSPEEIETAIKAKLARLGLAS